MLTAPCCAAAGAAVGQGAVSRRAGPLAGPDVRLGVDSAGANPGRRGRRESPRGVCHPKGVLSCRSMYLFCVAAPYFSNAEAFLYTA